MEQSAGRRRPAGAAGGTTAGRDPRQRRNGAGVDSTPTPNWNRNHWAWDGLPKADFDVIDQSGGRRIVLPQARQDAEARSG